MYKNINKTKARDIIWQNAINTVTSNRYQSAIVTDELICLYWEHIKKYLNNHSILDLEKTEAVINNFLLYKKIHLQTKTANEIKVLFFCGPEPEMILKYYLILVF